MAVINKIVWKPTDEDGRSYFRFNEEDTEKSINYETGNWKKYINFLPDKRKIDRFIIETHKKFHYCVGQKVGAKVKFIDAWDGHCEYFAQTYIYNIPTKEEVMKIFNYIKEVSEKKKSEFVFTDIEASYDKKYKYIIELFTDPFNQATFPFTALMKTRVPHKNVNNVYDYKDAVRRFGADFSKLIAKFKTKDGKKNVLEMCSNDEIKEEYAKKYKIFLKPHNSYSALEFVITNIPTAKKLTEYSERVKKRLKRYVSSVKIIDEKTIKVTLEVHD